MPERNRFNVLHNSPAGGRLGQLEAVGRDWTAQNSKVDTPCVFPVLNVIGGPAGPERNGGLWRPVKWWMFLHERIPGYLCQVLHALDYRIKGAPWEHWKSKPFGQWIYDWQEQVHYDGNPTRYDMGYPFRTFMKHWPKWAEAPASRPPVPPLTFLDSGGFTLMKADGFRKAKEWYGLDTSPKDILDLQLRLGGDVIASLDFPLPPGLSEEQMRERQERSLENGLELLRLLAEPDYQGVTAFPYIAVHGVTRDSARWYVETLFERWRHEPEAVRKRKFGLAIGSMVPRADNPRTVVEVAWGVREGVQSALSTVQELAGVSPPVHMFGISSHLIGFLTYVGVDTFDSQTYADVAKRANYLDEHLRPMRITEVTEDELAHCGCLICEHILELGILYRMQEILTPKERDHVNTDGVKAYYFPLLSEEERCTRSDLYGLLAMHNWQRIAQEVERVRSAIQENRLATYLAEIVRDHNGQRGHKLRDALAWMIQAEAECSADHRLKQAAQAVLGTIPLPLQRKAAVAQPIRRKRTPDEYQLLAAYDPSLYAEIAVTHETGENEPAAYQPPPGKKVLLLMACSKGKPYKDSAHQRQVLDELGAAFPASFDYIHKVTLSGLYGPVPAEHETLQQILDYDFRLEDGEGVQAALIERRLRCYLEQFGHEYQDIVAYVYFPAYRAVVQRVFRDLGVGRLVPAQTSRSAKPKQYRRELINTVATSLGEAATFTLNIEAYQPPTHSQVLLLLPSGLGGSDGVLGRNYIRRALRKAFPNTGVLKQLHWVTVSGRYGPVPEELEGDPRLTADDGALVDPAALALQLRAFLEKVSNHYRQIIAYMPDSEYRAVVAAAVKDQRPYSASRVSHLEPDNTIMAAEDKSVMVEPLHPQLLPTAALADDGLSTEGLINAIAAAVNVPPAKRQLRLL